jgi:hypothetical protein
VQVFDAEVLVALEAGAASVALEAGEAARAWARGARPPAQPCPPDVLAERDHWPASAAAPGTHIIYLLLVALIIIISVERRPLLDIIIIISLSQSTAGHMLLQYPAISLDLRLLASSSCQPSCANRLSTWPDDVLRYLYLDAVSTPELVYPSDYQFYG